MASVMVASAGDAPLALPVPLEVFDAASLLTAFADQGQNINGVLFQASLLPYLVFLYFLSYHGNNTPPMVQFGFQFLLAFVISTIPSGIISKTAFGVPLADADWLHGAAESLLTATNIFLVVGFRGAISGNAATANGDLFGIPNFLKVVGGCWLAAVVLTLATGVPVFGWEAHTPFLAGIGALPTEAEPVNALSVPTWVVHFTSVFEFLLAMSLAWKYAESSGNDKWKGMAWGMAPSQASGICACTYHVFYNQVPWLLTAQAAFTCLGNFTLALAACRIAVSNGWTFSELNPFRERPEQDENAPGGGFDVGKLAVKPASPEDAGLVPGPLLVLEVVLLSLLSAYVTKYGELGLESTFQTKDGTGGLAAPLIVVLPPLLVLAALISNSGDLKQGTLPPLALAGALGSDAGASEDANAA